MKEKLKAYIRKSVVVFLIGLMFMFLLMWLDASGGWIIYFALLWLLHAVTTMVLAILMVIYNLVGNWERGHFRRIQIFLAVFCVMVAIGALTDMVREGAWLNHSRAITLAGGGAFGIAFADLFFKGGQDFD